jgi:hypothetical protein
MADKHGLKAEIAEIERLPIEALRTRWRNLSGRLAPEHLSRALLIRILAYQIQAQAFGDLDRNTARTLERWNEHSATSRVAGSDERSDSGEAGSRGSGRERQTPEPLILKSGTVLTREWQGRMETVMAVGDGFAWNGEVFASLSAVALAMTGTKWNGHRFFGVRPQDRATRRPDDIGRAARAPDRDVVAERAGRVAVRSTAARTSRLEPPAKEARQ